MSGIPFTRRQLLTGAAAGCALVTLSGTTLATAASDSNTLTLQRLAWAGVRLSHAEVTLFVDAVAPDADHGMPGPILSSQARRSYALITHHHTDHYDPAALKPVLGDLGYLVCHSGVAPYVDTRVLKMQMAAMYEPVFLSRGGGEFAAWSVPAVDGLGSPQVSWVIDVAGRRLIHCGDTLWHGFWWDIARAYGPFDIALLPINGFRQNQRRYTDTGFPMGMTAEQAAAAAQLLQARVAIPIHYGQHTDPDYTEEPGALELFQAHAQQRGVKVLALAPGEEHNWTQLSRSTMP